MKMLKQLLAASIVVLLELTSVMAQSQGGPEEACGSAAGCGACGGLGLIVIVVPLGIIILNIALLIWVARDAKSRGMDSAVIWMILVMFTGVLGLIIYLFSRPQGDLTQCPSCNNKRLQASARCPHCGNG
jgi:uncharacterized membrane protein YhaH (DUF805 family)